MKVQLVKSEDSLIKGYKAIKLLPVKSLEQLNNLNLLSDNECEFILAANVLDNFSIQEIPSVITSLINKLRINGTLVIGGTDIRIFCKYIVNGLLSEIEGSDKISEKESMSNVQNIIDVIKNFGLKIQSSRIVGINYEITAIRN